jgi:hypothetical protein
MHHILALMLITSSLSPAPVTPTVEKDAEHPAPTATSETLRAGVRMLTSRERILKRRQAVRKSRANALRGGQQQSMDSLISLIQSNVAPDCWEFGGTGFSSGSGAANGSSNSLQNAENLAELIQQTARPLSWEINGGNGSISIFSN